MAKHAYLYTTNSDLSKTSLRSESKNPIPLIYLLLLGVSTKMEYSKKWKYPHPIAIAGHFETGVKKLHIFLTYLQTQKEIDQEVINKNLRLTTALLARPFENKDYFLLEAAEILFLSTAEDDPVENQNKDLFDEITFIAETVSEILEEWPDDVFAHTEAYWLHSLKKDMSPLLADWDLS